MILVMELEHQPVQMQQQQAPLILIQLQELTQLHKLLPMTTAAPAQLLKLSMLFLIRQYLL